MTGTSPGIPGIEIVVVGPVKVENGVVVDVGSVSVVVVDDKSGELDAPADDAIATPAAGITVAMPTAKAPRNLKLGRILLLII